MRPETSSRSTSSGRLSRHRVVAVLVGGLLLVLVVGVVAFWRGDSAPSNPVSGVGVAPGGGAPRQGARAGGQIPAGVAQEEAVEAAPRYDATTCWRELERFNDGVSLETFREWAAPLLASRDPLVRMYLKERLTELIGGDAGKAREVLEWTREAGPKEFKVFAMALKDSDAVHLPDVSRRILELGLDQELSPERRAGVLSALDTQKELSADALSKLSDFARDPASGEAGWAAARTIARVMKNDHGRTANAAPYLESLLSIGTQSLDEHVRYMALSTPMETAPVLDARATDGYAKVLTSEGSPDARAAAAHNLAVSEDRAKVLDTFTRAFEPEKDVCVRWALFRFSARAAGREALPVMAKMALLDPRFQPLYQDFERVYASGVVDFERVWNALADQDPLGCLHHD
ncbi:hypothetical protein LXT21_00640 [Myxococcus sp. K38C18041901]|uniref:hypothetical protein n=1 Tax=Myxococcus guangdongensis TaxID=2906760 RepID=UPI0020A7ECD1|nr:hypothetical protein [Myxococcus guangdongensis]MCP3057277.1 hypothetical protein [Myxococcus guangdongensis]